MKSVKKFDRRRLREILAYYDVSLRGFDGLRPNCYEQAVAGHSLEQLDLLYAQIFGPGKSLEEAVKICPPWPEGTPLAGSQPKVTVLQGIFDRFEMEWQTERVLGVMSEQADVTARFRQAIHALSPAAQTKALDQMITVIHDEVARRKIAGIPVVEQLPAVDRMMTREKIAVRDRAGKVTARKLKLQERKQQQEEKKGEEAGKAGSVTTENWEEIERVLKLA